MNYRDLEIWQIARIVVVQVHKLTMEQLPRHEMFEEGSQIRRSCKSIKSNIVEGFGRRRYKQEFIRFLTYAHASCDETIDHLETLFETGSLTDKNLYAAIGRQLDELGRKLSRFIAGVEREHKSEK